jgi:hypothetical protein
MIAFDGREGANLRQNLADAERTSDRLHTQIEQLIASNRDLSGLLLAADRRRGELMKLIIAFCRLIEATDALTGVRTLEEILVTIIGTEDFVVFAFADDNRLGPICGVGPVYDFAKRNPPDKSVACPAEKVPGAAATKWLGSEVAACVPMRIGEHLVGVIVIASLLVHRESLSVQDQEVLRHLGDFAATAIMSAEERHRWTRLVVPTV